ncbi:MAG: hypothetical protein LBC35_07715 [Coriobacteriales bacterium]|jgi:hypothetical protein|nr:hypothetical protein [Coriobacteriales bacterium]
MAAVVILTLVLTMILAGVYALTHRTSQVKRDTQAYYTALSALKTVTTYLADSDTDTQEAFLASVPAQGTPDFNQGYSFDVGDMDASATGSCSITLRWTTEAMDTLRVISTATFADTTESCYMDMPKQVANNLGTIPSVAYTIDPSAYLSEAIRLNSAPLDTAPIKVGDSSTANNSGKNASDISLLDGSIDSTSIKESLWTADAESQVLGSQTYPLNGAGGKKPDTRRWQSGKNGRLLVNPLEKGSHVNDNVYSYMNEQNRGDTNTKLTSLSIDTANAATDHIYLRLANVTTSDARYNALLMLNFTDNATEPETAAGFVYHPNNWDDLTVYLRQDANLNTNVLFGPFGHKYSSWMDYWSWGDFVDNWHGTQTGEFAQHWPWSSNTTHFKNAGLPIFEADYYRAGFYVLDANSSYLRFLQGVNIIEGSIYSNRPTIIGGGLIKSESPGKTTDYVNSGVNGFNEQTSNTYAAVYTDATNRFGQMIYDTDIILASPEAGRTVESTIRRPTTWSDRIFLPTSIPTHDKTYEPQMNIIDGSIYVDAGQSLTIQGAVLDNMHIRPKEIVVKTGGSLTIESSDFTNIETNIYVDGGSLIIKPGAKIKGNIFVFNSGQLRIEGSFTLDSLSTDPQKQALDGIYLFGKDTVGQNTITSAGKLAVTTANTSIAGTANRIHLIGCGSADALINTNMPAGAPGPADIADLLCSPHANNGECGHYCTQDHFVKGVYSSYHEGM